jgi:dimethylhistidine N-methyltransferase
MRVQPAVTLDDEIRAGLTDPRQKRLPAKALYDEVGSALFDAITALPEYGLTRADIRLLHDASHAIAAHSGAREIVELGSGSGTKTRVLLSGFAPGVLYRPIDVSAAALERCRAELSEFDVQPVQAEFLPGLRTAAAERDGAPILLAFVGSNIGNFDRPDIAPFLREIRSELSVGDTLLLGVDLVKSVEQLLLAYDDPAGVTAAFNRNLLSRLNREYDAAFNVRCFAHEARWNQGERRIEMHLRSEAAQRVLVGKLSLELTVEAGETIWTESSHKFEIGEVMEFAEAAGFRAVAQWIDTEWPFAELLFAAV